MKTQIEHPFAVGDMVAIVDDRPGDTVWRITEIVTDDPEHDGPYARLVGVSGPSEGYESWSALRILVHYRPRAVEWLFGAGRAVWALLPLILMVAGAVLVTAAWWVPDPQGEWLALAGIACAGFSAVRVLGIRRGGAR